MRRHVWFALLGLGCGSPTASPLFTVNPECQGAAITPTQGDAQLIVTRLRVSAAAEGRDVDGDGKPDNKLAGVASLAELAIAEALAWNDLLLPLELFDMPTLGGDACVKLAAYVGTYGGDRDGDSRVAARPKGDCNDLEAQVSPRLPELPGNFRDDDCDGLADETVVDGTVRPGGDSQDRDGDGVTIAAGDCDDTRAEVAKGLPERCDDGLDNDCDGVADRSVDANGMVTACSPYASDASQTVGLAGRSLVQGQPTTRFVDGTLTATAQGAALRAGPSRFALALPITATSSLAITLSGAMVELDLTQGPHGVTVPQGRLTGVLAAHDADAVTGLALPELGLMPNDTLLDALFGNLLGALLALPRPAQAPVPGCMTPDIDVDRDGLEMFCDTTPNDEHNAIDVCIDGDGEVVRDAPGAPCGLAQDAAGGFRFVDGISAAFAFTAVPVRALVLTP